ncbi:response regulator [Iningainema tapete]|uniref:Response regulator n=1 Tax=Iningainema tapete BLCC-T55 TaxID=2748662 RepID=A0A8J6XVN7_9CYAN|nr:response regulator [Iningainema tapete]MBD2777052.1 response regulator [Iningainema tapete BLCC-T55]
MTATTSFTEQNNFSNLNGLQVLVVDDNADCRDLLKFLLEEFFVVVKIATSVQEALLVLGQWQPDILISSIALPGEDGYSLMRQIRILEESQQAKPLAAIAITTLITEKACIQALDCGFSMYVEKPFNLDALLASIDYLARQNR